MEITLSDEFVIQCGTCASPLDARVGLSSTGKRLIEIDPCEKCLREAEADGEAGGRFDGQELAEERS